MFRMFFCRVMLMHHVLMLVPILNVVITIFEHLYNQPPSLLPTATAPLFLGTLLVMMVSNTMNVGAPRLAQEHLV